MNNIEEFKKILNSQCNEINKKLTRDQQVNKLAFHVIYWLMVGIFFAGGVHLSRIAYEPRSNVINEQKLDEAWPIAEPVNYEIPEIIVILDPISA